MDIVNVILEILYYVLIIGTLYRLEHSNKRNIISWRIGIIFLIAYIFYLLNGKNITTTNLAHVIVFFGICTIFFPFFSTQNTCKHCGNRFYFHSLYSNKCPNCGESIFW